MSDLWIRILALFQRWPKACKHIEAAMVTPALAYKDVGFLKTVCKQLAKSDNFNSICGLVDQQDGRGRGQFGKPGTWIIQARKKTKLTADGERNLRAVLASGITPILITHNDYIAQKPAPDTTIVPSLDGPPPARLADFYAPQNLSNEKRFLSSLKPYFPYIHIQLSLESTHALAAGFCNEMAKHLRREGFKGRIIVNPLDDSNDAYKADKAAFDELGVDRAQSHHKATPPPDKIWNTDGNTQPNAANAFDWMRLFRASGKEWIFHTQELKMVCPPNPIPKGYL